MHLWQQPNLKGFFPIYLSSSDSVRLTKTSRAPVEGKSSECACTCACACARSCVCVCACVCLMAFFGFSHIKHRQSELRCERVRERNDSRYEPFEISPETIEQELRPVVCEQRQIV